MRFALHGCDVFVAIAGGVRVVEPALDLGVLLAVASSIAIDCLIRIQS